MTVAELIQILSGMQGDRFVHVRIQGVSQPLAGVFTESGQSVTVDEDGAVQQVPVHRVVMSDRQYR